MNQHVFQWVLGYIQSMVIVHSEEIKSDFEGTIIDIESIGDFCRGYPDSREYQDIIPVIFGYIDKNELNIHCAKGIESVDKIKNIIVDTLPNLTKPLYAFNSNFERGSFYHTCGIAITFHGELDRKKYESKRNAVITLGIENYDDPFNDIGNKCKLAWEKGKYKLSMKHNRSCLLKERDILMKRGFRTPDEMILYSSP